MGLKLSTKDGIYCYLILSLDSNVYMPLEVSLLNLFFMSFSN